MHFLIQQNSWQLLETMAKCIQTTLSRDEISNPCTLEQETCGLMIEFLPQVALITAHHCTQGFWHIFLFIIARESAQESVLFCRRGPEELEHSKGRCSSDKHKQIRQLWTWILTPQRQFTKQYDIFSLVLQPQILLRRRTIPSGLQASFSNEGIKGTTNSDNEKQITNNK